MVFYAASFGGEGSYSRVLMRDKPTKKKKDKTVTELDILPAPMEKRK